MERRRQEDIVMKTRSFVQVWLAVVVTSLLLQPGSIWAQKGKGPAATTTPLTALFRENLDIGSSVGDKIRSDGLGLYSTVRDPDKTYASVVQLDADGRLNMQILRHRRVFLVFDTPVRAAPLDSNGRVICREYGSGTEFQVDPPSFLTGVPDNDSFYFATFGKITYDGAQWVYDPSIPFDFRTMAVDPAASELIRMQISFYTAADSGLFGVMPNYRLGSADTAVAGGVAKVTHPSTDVWVIEPQTPDDPAVPLRSLGPNEAGFKVTAPAVKRVHAGGNCDLGDWVMPFQLTLYRQ
jgi:hypothetical protein